MFWLIWFIFRSLESNFWKFHRIFFVLFNIWILYFQFSSLSLNNVSRIWFIWYQPTRRGHLFGHKRFTIINEFLSHNRLCFVAFSPIIVQTREIFLNDPKKYDFAMVRFREVYFENLIIKKVAKNFNNSELFKNFLQGDYARKNQ